MAMGGNPSQHLGEPANEHVAITPNDGSDIPNWSLIRFVHVGGAGVLVWRDANDTQISYTLAAGWHPIRPKRVMATGTTATEIRGLW